MSDYRQQEGLNEQQWRESLKDKHPSLRAWPGKTHMNVYQKLTAARTIFHAKKLKKSGKNTFANYEYFELGDFLIPGLQSLADAGLCPLPVTFRDGYASMTIVDMDKPEDRITFESPMGSAALKGCHEVQNIGAVETYQRRYLWVAALEIVEHDALDASTGKDVRSVKHTPTDGPIDIDESRQTLIKLAASIAAELFKNGEKDASFDKIEEFTQDNEEHLFLQSVLKPHSALRAYIKFRLEQARKRATTTVTEEEF